MPAFQYRARNQRGEMIKGRIEGASADAVATQLFNSGVTPIDIASSHADDVLGLFGRAGGGKIRLIDLALFSRQMFTLLKAGVPIMQALRGLRDTTHSPALARVIVSLSESLDQGLDLGTAMRRFFATTALPLALLASAAAAQQAPVPQPQVAPLSQLVGQVDIPYQTFTLPIRITPKLVRGDI